MASNLIQPILVIEDSEEDFESFRRIIHKSSIIHPVYRCADGDDALDFLYHNGEYIDDAKAPRPAIILLDLNLPGTDGREVLEQIKHDDELKIIPVVVFTTSANPMDIEICYRQGVNGYILKPVDIKKLMETVKVLIDYWLETVTLPDVARGQT